MFCAYTRPRYQISVYKTIGPLVLLYAVETITLLSEQNKKSCQIHNNKHTIFG